MLIKLTGEKKRFYSNGMLNTVSIILTRAEIAHTHAHALPRLEPPRIDIDTEYPLQIFTMFSCIYLLFDYNIGWHANSKIALAMEWLWLNIINEFIGAAQLRSPNMRVSLAKQTPEN